MIQFRIVVFALIATVLVACGRLPTEPRCSTTTVYAAESFYGARSEPEQDWSGIVSKQCPPPSPNGRDLCFALGGTALYAEGTTARAIFDPLVGKDVTIRGKLVNVGYGPEIWPAAVTSCR